ncbi:hypothetical protein Gogos_021685 [Gossypium gossypioides]|uniref:Uncharacterized protein n=1 Tax=Gossypium gossypioides TaxID=34282 RepID=A0A7J9D5W3_GOSGO|nr:hypothetical protein [Gossypium gossypioides]
MSVMNTTSIWDWIFSHFQ